MHSWAIDIDLRWWRQKLADPKWAGSRVLTEQLTTPIAIKSDASGEFGAGFHQLQVDNPVWGCWPWSAEQRKLYGSDMVAKELDPLVEAVREHGRKWRGRLLNVATDNTGAIFSLNAGRAKSRAARQLMRDLADAMKESELDIAAQWVPRELNVVADLLSRQFTLDAKSDAAYRKANAVIADYAASGNYLGALERVAPSPLSAAGA